MKNQNNKKYRRREHINNGFIGSARGGSIAVSRRQHRQAGG